MTTYTFLVCSSLSLSDITDVISVLISAVTLWVAWIIYTKYAAQQLLSKQIEAVYKLIEHLHNDSIDLCFGNVSHRGHGCKRNIINVFEIADISRTKENLWSEYSDDLLICFENGSNQIFDIKSFIQNPFTPKSISDKLIDFYSTYHTSFNSDELHNIDIVECIIITSKHYEKTINTIEEEIPSLIYQQGNATALKNLLSLKTCANNLEISIENWLINNGIKREDVNIRHDFINKPIK